MEIKTFNPEIIKTSLATALYSNTSIEDITKEFAINLTSFNEHNSPFISKLSSEMRQSARLRAILRHENMIISEIGSNLVSIMDNFFPHIKYTISGREKTIFSDVNKRISKLIEGKSAQIQDLFALRLIVLNQDDETTNINNCYRILEKFLKIFSFMETDFQTSLSWDLSIKEVPYQLKNVRNAVIQKFPYLNVPNESKVNPIFRNSVKDYIFFPNNSGYQSLHFTISYKGCPVEIQIRTLNMHYWSEHGPAKHSVYKGKRSFKDITLECFEEQKIKSPHYILNKGTLLLYPGLITAIPFFDYSST